MLKNGLEGKGKGKEKWFLHRKIRKVARAEVSDALEMRGRVIVGMVVVMVLIVLGFVMGLKWVFVKCWWRS